MTSLETEEARALPTTLAVRMPAHRETVLTRTPRLWGCSALLFAACASEPDAHFEVTRVAGEVTVQLCDPGSALDCRSSVLFAGEESAATVKTLDVFVEDQTTALDLILSQEVGIRFCHRLAVTFGGPINAVIALGSEPATEPVVEGCETCRLEACAR